MSVGYHGAAYDAEYAAMRGGGSKWQVYVEGGRLNWLEFFVSTGGFVNGRDFSSKKRLLVSVIAAMSAAEGYPSGLDYVLARLNEGMSNKVLQREVRAAIALYHPAEAARWPGYPGLWHLDRWFWRILWGNADSPERKAISAARERSHEINRQRKVSKMGYDLNAHPKLGRKTIKPDGTPLTDTEKKRRYRAKLKLKAMQSASASPSCSE